MILDTHVWVWLNIGSEKLRSETVTAIESAAKFGRVNIPAIVPWEVATLVAKGRLTLKLPIGEWIEEALSKQGVSLINLTPQIAVESTVLPGRFHGDPADRLIIATSRITHIPIITRDEKILAYAKTGFITAISA